MTNRHDIKPDECHIEINSMEEYEELERRLRAPISNEATEYLYSIKAERPKDGPVKGESIFRKLMRLRDEQG